MTWLPRSPGSTLVLWLNQETVHDFILLCMPPCGSYLTPLATGSIERSLLLFSTPGGLTGDDLSRLFFTCTNTSQAATCTCITWPRISPHNVVNHSSHKEATIHRSSNHTWSSENQCGKKIKTLRSNHGGEYLSHEFSSHLKSCKIIPQLTPPGAPQRNGVSEQHNGTLLVMVQSMMSQSDLPLSFWGYALETMVSL
jgi:hypothetical protein